MEALYPVERGHKNNFDFARFILATTVVFCHSYVVYYGTLDQEPLWRLSRKQLSLGTLAINFFFIISGFLISQSWDRSTNLSSFLKKRILRIYPAFIFVCIAGAFLFAPLGRGIPLHLAEYWSAIDGKYFVYRTLTLREPVLPETFKTLPYPNKVNNALWSISYEFICYLIIPLCAVIGAFQKPFRVFLLFAATLLINVIDYDAYHLYGPKSLLGYTLIPQYFQKVSESWINFEHLLLPFTAGMCFYTYRRHIPRSIYLAALSLFILIITARWLNYFEIAQSIFGAYLLFYFVFDRRVKLHDFSKYGDFSYGIYLYGWPVQQLVILYAGSKLNLPGFFMVSMAVALPLAAISWYVIEKPFLRLKSKPLPSTSQILVS